MWGPPGGGKNFPDDFDNFHQSIFDDMDRIFGQFGFSRFPMFPGMNENDIGFFNQIEDRDDGQKSLRDGVLKKPDEDHQQINDKPRSYQSQEFHRPHHNHMNSWIESFFHQPFQQLQIEPPLPKNDIDLDDEVARKGVNAVLDNQINDEASTPHTMMRGYFKSESTTRNSDGVIERKVVERDSSGNYIETVTVEHPDGTVESKSIGDETKLPSVQNEQSLRDQLINSNPVENMHKIENFPEENYPPPSKFFDYYTSLRNRISDMFTGRK